MCNSLQDMKLMVNKIKFTGSRNHSMDSSKHLELGIVELIAT